jgi:hypothetical protein
VVSLIGFCGVRSAEADDSSTPTSLRSKPPHLSKSLPDAVENPGLAASQGGTTIG